jgi:hypothetical protein
LKKYLSIMVIFFCSLLAGNAQNFSIGAGVNFGGPLPTETVENSEGKPILGTNIGVSYSIPLSKRFSFNPALYYSLHGVDYSQNFTRDTLITVVINNQSGQVPSFYTAYITGGMRLHYIDIPLLVTYRIGKSQIMFGPYVSVLVGGKDAGKVRVVIGTGGFLEDFHDEFNNFNAIRKVEQGLMIGSTIPIYKNLSIESRISRSFFSLYSPGKLPNMGDSKMFNTFFNVGLVYKIKRD